MKINWKDRESVLKAVKQNGLLLASASKQWRGDSEIVLTAIKQNPKAFAFASRELKNNAEFILLAVKETSFLEIMLHCQEVRSNRKAMLKLIQADVRMVRCVSPKIADQNFYIQAIQLNNMLLNVFLQSKIPNYQQFLLALVKLKAIGFKPDVEDAIEIDKVDEYIAIELSKQKSQEIPPEEFTL